MKYNIKSVTIKELSDKYEKGLIDLKPYYQRNDIWSKVDQQLLIDSILKGYPLPSFFTFQREPGKLEMVDGQQRSRTILRFLNQEISNSKNDLFSSDNESDFLNYELPFIEITEIKDDQEIEELYVLLNKRGKHLNTPELHKAEFSNTNFLQTVESLLEYQKFIDLNLFTDATSRRMNDRNFIEELAALLIHGVQDKKKIIETIYQQDITKSQQKELSGRFKSIIDRVSILNKYVPIYKTRYKQKNDFYTLFSFVAKNKTIDDETLMHQYKILLKISPHISPSLEECPSLREYAINCVSQSNSKKARMERLRFFDAILLNKSSDLTDNPILSDVLNYIESFNLFNVQLDQIGEYCLIKVD